MRNWLFAQLYERGSRRAEVRGLWKWRRGLLEDLSGDVCEIGAGNGLNLRHYPAAVTRLVLTEPSPHMRRLLRARLEVPAGTQVDVLEGHAEAIPLPANSVDHVVSTLVLCSVTDLHAALAEAKRVLRPGGSLVFMEHVAATNGRVRTWQERVDPIWSRVADGCHMCRDTEAAIAAAGFHVEQIKRDPMKGAPALLAPAIRGRATLP